MKVAITSADTFVAPYIQEMLGDSAVLVPEEIPRRAARLPARRQLAPPHLGGVCVLLYD